MYGYGIMSSYKSDWNRFGGECNFVVVLVGSGKLVEMVGGRGRGGVWCRSDYSSETEHSLTLAILFWSGKLHFHTK